jgi:hypothetical protein
MGSLPNVGEIYGDLLPHGYHVIQAWLLFLPLSKISTCPGSIPFLSGTGQSLQSFWRPFQAATEVKGRSVYLPVPMWSSRNTGYPELLHEIALGLSKCGPSFSFLAVPLQNLFPPNPSYPSPQAELT